MPYKCDFCCGEITASPNEASSTISYLPCFHAICQRCKASRFRNQERVVCVVCHCQPQQNEIFDLVLPDPAKLVCSSCKDSQRGRAEWCCQHCNGHSLCSSCSINHRQAGHNVASLIQDVPHRSQCSNHVNVQANFLCSCGMRLCNNCVSLHSHGGNEAAHNRRSFGTLAEIARQKLNSLKTAQHKDSLGIQKVVPTLAQNKKLVREMAQRARTAVASEVVELCNALMRRGNDIVTAIDMVEDAKLKQYAKTESDLKFAQDRLKKIEFFIDMATTSMPHDPPGIVSANVFAESAYNLFGAKWEQVQRGLEISQRTPNLQYFSDLPPIVNSLRTLGQLDVDGVVKTPSSATPENARMFSVTSNPFPTHSPSAMGRNVMRNGVTMSSQMPSTSKPIVFNNNNNIKSGPLVGNGPPQQPSHLHLTNGFPPHMPHNMTPQVLSPQFMHAAQAHQAMHAQQQHMMAVQREAMMNNHHPPFAQPNCSGPQSIASTSSCSGPHGPRAMVPPFGMHPSAALVAAAQQHHQRHTLNPHQHVLHNGISMAQGPMTPTRLHIATGISNLSSSSPVMHVSMPGEHCDSPVLTAHLLGQSSSTPPTSKQAKVKIFESSVLEEGEMEEEEESVQKEKSCEPAPTVLSAPPHSTTPDSTVIIPSTAVGQNKTVHVRPQKRNLSEDPSAEEQTMPKRANIIVEGEEEEEIEQTLVDRPPEEINSSEAVERKELQLTEQVGSNASPSVTTTTSESLFGVKLETRSPRETAKEVQPGNEEEESGKENSPTSDIQQAVVGNEPSAEQNGQQSNVDQWEDYCYVCNQGCDEYTGELGCCFGCPKVYHNCCHVPAIKQQMVDLPDDWKCSMCTSCEPLTTPSDKFGKTERVLCSKVLLACFREHQQAEPFLHEVSRNNVTYHSIIKEPITLKDVAQMISLRRYEKIEEFMEDMNKIFRNCSTFNGPSDPIARAGRAVYSHYLNAVRQYLPAYINNVWVYIALYDTRNSEEGERGGSSPSATSSRIRSLKRTKREHSLTKGAT